MNPAFRFVSANRKFRPSGLRLAFALAIALGPCFSGRLAAAADEPTRAVRFVDKVEQFAATMLPQEKFNRALGFFGPVTKKYMPVFDKFNGEYLSSTNKLDVVKKYLPRARDALAEAKAMRIPAKYEAEKAEYVRMAETFLTVVDLAARFGK